MDPTDDQAEQPDGATETPSIDYRTATPEEVAVRVTELDRMGSAGAGPDTSGVDWANISKDEFHREASKRGINLRR